MNMIKLSVLKNRLSGILSVWVPEFFSCFWYIVGWKPEYRIFQLSRVYCQLWVSHPYRTHTHTRGNSVAHEYKNKRFTIKYEECDWKWDFYFDAFKLIKSSLKKMNKIISNFLRVFGPIGLLTFACYWLSCFWEFSVFFIK